MYVADHDQIRRKIAAIYLLVSAIVGPKVEHAAQMNESTITTMNCVHGKNTPRDNPRISDSCSDMV